MTLGTRSELDISGVTRMSRLSHRSQWSKDKELITTKRHVIPPLDGCWMPIFVSSLYKGVIQKGKERLKTYNHTDPPSLPASVLCDSESGRGWSWWKLGTSWTAGWGDWGGGGGGGGEKREWVTRGREWRGSVRVSVCLSPLPPPPLATSVVITLLWLWVPPC